MSERTLFSLLFMAAIVFCAFASGWSLRDMKARAEDGARASAEMKAKGQMEVMANAISAKTEAAIQNIRVENRTIYQKVQNEITEKPVYRDCVLPIDGVRLVNAARSGSAGQLDGAVPANSDNTAER